MKNFVNIMKILLFYIIVNIFSVFFVEMSRISSTQEALIMFNRIASNYALTATQDVRNITGSENVGNATGYSTGQTYKIGEYDKYLNVLRNSGCEDLKPIVDLLQIDYDNVVADGHGDCLDNYLTYTPISFNLPYINKDLLKSEYEYALMQMFTNYKCSGYPSLFVPMSGSNGFNSDEIESPIIIDNNSVSDIDSARNDSGFIEPSVVEVDANLVREIYGDEDYYSKLASDVFSEIEWELYDDPRMTALATELRLHPDAVTDVDDLAMKTHVPVYHITFKTPCWYITKCGILRFGVERFLFGTNDVIANGIRNSDRANIYHDDILANNLSGAGLDVDTYGNGSIYQNGMVDDGQLMIQFRDSVITTTYTFLS